MANIVLCSRLADGVSFLGQLTYRFRLSQTRVCRVVSGQLEYVGGRRNESNEDLSGKSFLEFW